MQAEMGNKDLCKKGQGFERSKGAKETDIEKTFIHVAHFNPVRLLTQELPVETQA